MNQHQQINQEFERQYAFLADAAIIAPSALAYRVYETFCAGDEEPRIQYTSLEHLKQMARAFLRRKKDADGEENETHGAQGGFDFGTRFSGHLQDRYPLPHKDGDEPAYKLRALLSPFERAWNVAQLRKSADARNAHADALEAEGQERSA